MKKLELIGRKFGKLLVVSTAENAGRRTMWLCKCDCGNTKVINADPLNRGLTKSCGCLTKETTAKRSFKHGHTINHTHSKEWKSWSHAKSRCLNKKDFKYRIYGARGIIMSPEWVNDFTSFIKYMGPCPKGHSLDRINVNGNYEPGNCRWASAKEQALNTRKNVYCNIFGRRMTLSQIADELKLTRQYVHSRIRYHNDDPEVLWDLKKVSCKF